MKITKQHLTKETRSVFKRSLNIFLVLFLVLSSAQNIKADNDKIKKIQQVAPKKAFPRDSIFNNIPFSPDIIIEKGFLYDKHTLKDEYTYGKTNRKFQWDKIERKLALVDSVQRKKQSWAILQNYKNKNGLPPLVKGYKKDAYNQIADKNGMERSQGIPLYLKQDTISPDEYGHDGAWTKILNTTDTASNWVDVQDLFTGKKWTVPKKYVKTLADTISFTHVIVVDVKNQNITTLEKKDLKWFVRSMNPATTGKHNPPHMKETPLGIFLLQEKKSRMYYLVDGTNEIAGFAPFASRFSDGGYIHGVPLVNPNTELIEYSWTLGTVPRSHMCVRNATSHAKFVYDWAPTQRTLIFVID